MKDKDFDQYKLKLLTVLVRHIGKRKAIRITELSKIFGNVEESTNWVRLIRYLINQLREEGVPICSDSDREDEYYLASTDAEIENFCMRLRIKALKTLMMEASLRKKPLPELLNQIISTLEHKGQDKAKENMEEENMEENMEVRHGGKV